MPLYLGVDNGLTGGVALVDEVGKIHFTAAMQTQQTRKGNEVDVVAMRDIISLWLSDLDLKIDSKADVVVVMEEPGGAKSFKAAVSMAASFHALRAMFELWPLRLERITPQKWQRDFLNAPKGQTKPVALQKAKSIWPSVDFRRNSDCRVPDAGIIDACLIAEWARREKL